MTRQETKNIKREEDIKHLLFLVIINMDAAISSVEGTRLEVIKPALERSLYEINNLTKVVDILIVE